MFILIVVVVATIVSAHASSTLGRSNTAISNPIIKNNRHHRQDIDILAAAKSSTKSSIPQVVTSGSSDLSSSILNLAKTILGAGVLSLPSGIALFSDSKHATVPAIFLLALMGFASAYSFSSVGKACQLHGVSSFSEAFAKSLGLSNGRAISTIITLKTFFACLAYSIIIGTSMSSCILRHYYSILFYCQH